jgi:hypothetical protein
MAILMKSEVPGATAEQYDRVNASMGVLGDDTAPEGLIQHICGKTENGLVIIDVWESEEKLNRFFEEKAGPALAAADVDFGQPQVFPVHRTLKGCGTQPNVIVEVTVERSSDVYDELVSRMPAHVGDGSAHPVVSHVAAVTPSNGVYVVDLWESPERFGAFAEQELAPAAGDSLGEIQPRFTPVHNVVRGRTAVTA